MSYTINKKKLTHKTNKKKYRKRKSMKLYGGNGPYYTNSVPTLKSNIDKAINIATGLVNNFIAIHIDKISAKLGVDPNKPASENMKNLINSIKVISAELNTPEGEELKRALEVLFKNIVLILEPSIQESVRILDENVPKVAASIVRIINTALQAFPPYLAVSELLNLLIAGSQTGIVALELVQNSIETSEKLRPIEQELESGLNKFMAFIDYALTKTNQLALTELQEQDSQQLPQSFTPQKKFTPQQQIYGGNNFKSTNYYNKQKILIGGRIQHSINEFNNNK